MLSLLHLRVLAAVAGHGIGHGRREGAAVHPAVRQPPPRTTRSRDGHQADAARRPRDQADPRGELLAQRAIEIIGRVDAAAAELAAHVGLNAGRVRLAGFQSVLSALVPAAATDAAHAHPGSS